MADTEKTNKPKNPRAAKYKKKHWTSFAVEMPNEEYEAMMAHIEKFKEKGYTGYTRNGFARAAIKMKIYLDEHPDEMP